LKSFKRKGRNFRQGFFSLGSRPGACGQTASGLGISAQVGFEYLLTFGWALVLSASIFGLLVFLLPQQSMAFVSQSEEVPVVEATVVGSVFRLSLLNSGNSAIEITGVSSDSFENLVVNGLVPGSENSVFVEQGAAFSIEGSAPGPKEGTIFISCLDGAGAEKSVAITARPE